MRLLFLALAVCALVAATTACDGPEDAADPEAGNDSVICDARAANCLDRQDATLSITPTPFFPATATSQAELAATIAPASTSPSSNTSPGPQAIGCGPAGARDPGDTAVEITTGGLVRNYVLHIPHMYTGQEPVPLVINFHGYGSNATDQALYSGFPALADAEGFIVVSPNGSGFPQRWAFPGLGGVDEVAFIRELLDELQAELCIDASRIYATGMSNGGAITTFIACALPDRIAAIGAVAATAGPRACATAEPIPIITFRSTEDQCVPYGGGTSACGMQLPVLAVEEVMRLWGEHNGCDLEPRTAQLTEHVMTTEYTGCSAGVGTILYTTVGDGHTWPGAVNVPRLGHVTDEIDATSIIWDFFQAHAR